MSYWDKFGSKGISFMDNADKGNLHDVLGEKVHIVDFGFIKNDEGDYGVIQLAEHDGMFYFANQVITDMLHQVETDGMKEEPRDLAGNMRVLLESCKQIAFNRVMDEKENEVK